MTKTRRVIWECDVEDGNDLACEADYVRAAKAALAAIKRRGSMAHLFEVRDYEGNAFLIDLNGKPPQVIQSKGKRK